MQEIPANFTAGKGVFKARVTEDDSAIEFVLSYSGLSGPAAVAHVHIGQFFANGAVSFFLCGGSTKPPCPPATSGTVSGTITAKDVTGPADQGIAPGNLAAVLSMMRRGLTYANIHSARFPKGEIRGQVGARGNEPEGDDEQHDDEDR